MIESTRAESPSTVASHYDELDLFYREIWGLHVHHGYWETGRESSLEATEKLLTELFRGIEIPKGARLCDIGCGYGETSRYLARRHGANVTGYSVSSAQVKLANEMKDSATGRQLEFHCQDWSINQEKPESMDLAFAIESTEHMPDLRVFFEQAYRVLKPRGRLQICAWLSKEDPAPWELNHLLRPICTEGRLHLGTASEYLKLIEETGFSSSAYQDVTKRVKKTWTLCLQRLLGKLLTDSKYARFLIKDPSRNKMFVQSLLRIRLAYETRSMRYGIFSIVK